MRGMDSVKDKCDGHDHMLIEIYRRHGAASDAVVRWCIDCGAVVVDEDSDNRTSPGQYGKMRFPRMTYPNQRTS
jgi:hypothetical protein